MDIAIITWLSVLTLVCMVVLAKMFLSMRQRPQAQPVRVRSHHHSHLLEFSNEREMLFIPGDNMRTDGYDNDFNADDNF